MNSDVCWGLLFLDSNPTSIYHHISIHAWDYSNSHNRSGTLFQIVHCRNSHIRELSPYLPGDGGDKVCRCFVWFVMTFWCETPKKEHGNEYTTTLRGKSILTKKGIWGGMLSASGDTISEWNGWCVHHPPKKNNGRDARDDAGPKVHGIDFYQSKVFWKSETVDTAVAHCLKDATVEGVEHISTVETAVAAARPQIYRFFCVVFPQFFFHCCLGCELKLFIYFTTPHTENHSGFISTQHLELEGVLVDGGDFSRWISQRQICQFTKRSIPDLDGKSRIQPKNKSPWNDLNVFLNLAFCQRFHSITGVYWSP